MWTIKEPSNKAEILAFLNTDRRYAAYAIGDLEPGLFDHCTWFGADQGQGIESLVLVYRGLNPPALFLMGEVSGLARILERGRLPTYVYFTCREEHIPLTKAYYTWENPIPMWRMVLKIDQFTPRGAGCTRLTTAHTGELQALYDLGVGNAFSPAQLVDGIFYGRFVEDQLVSAGGTHLVSKTYNVAAVGNIFTHPAHRRKGYGSAATSAVVSELIDLEISDIVLNVSQENEPAIHLYKRLGFKIICPFIEGHALKITNRDFTVSTSLAP